MSAFRALRKAADERGLKTVTFRYREHGVDIYSNGLITQDKTMAENPDLVRRFMRAAVRGIVFAMENSDKAVDSYYKYNSCFERKLIQGQWNTTSRNLRTPEAKAARSIWYISRKQIKTTRDVMTLLMDQKFELQEGVVVDKFIYSRPASDEIIESLAANCDFVITSIAD